MRAAWVEVQVGMARGRGGLRGDWLLLRATHFTSRAVGQALWQ